MRREVVGMRKMKMLHPLYSVLRGIQE